MPTRMLATAGDREVLLGSLSIAAPRQAAEAVEPAIVATIADTTKTSKLAVAISRYSGRRLLAVADPNMTTGALDATNISADARRLQATSLVEYQVTVRKASATEVMDCMEGAGDRKLTDALKRNIKQLNLEDEFTTNGGGMQRLSMKQRSIKQSQPIGGLEAPNYFNNGGGVKPTDDSDASAPEEVEADYTYYYGAGGVLVLGVGVAIFMSQTKTKTTPVQDISAMEEAKPERKPKKSKEVGEIYAVGEDGEEAKPPKADDRKQRRTKGEPGTRGARRHLDELSDPANASTTASSAGSRRPSDVSTAAPPSSVASSVPRGAAPGQLRRAGTESLGAAPGQLRRTGTENLAARDAAPRRYADADSRRGKDGRMERRTAGPPGAAEREKAARGPRAGGAGRVTAAGA